MFPIPWNFPLRKKNGKLVNIGDAIDEGTEIPEHGESDAGKVLSVDEEGNLEWSDEVNTEIQTLEDKLDDEVETRATLGAHNWLAGKFTSQTLNNIEFNALPDGTVTASGTASATASTIASSSWVLKAGTYILSSNPLPAGSGKYTYISLVKKSDTSTFVAAERTESALFTLSEDTEIFARVSCQGNGETFDVVFKPMIRLASDLYTEYTEYAMTNRELTDKLKIEDIVITPSDGITVDYKHCYKIGNTVFLNFRFLFGSTATIATNAVIATVDKKPKSQILFPSFQTWDCATGDIVSLDTNRNLIMSSVTKFAINKNFFIIGSYITED